MDDELAALVALNEMAGLRGNKLADLYSRTNSYSQILRAYNRKLDPSIFITQYKQAGIRLVSFWDIKYPSWLRLIEGRPALLYVKGEVEILRQPMVAVVGSRQMDLVDEQKTVKVVDELVDKDMVVVSGLAKGIDGVAHRRTIDRGGKTVAVLGHGLERIYPVEHEGLARRIIDGGGAVVSELPMGAEIEKKYFLARNRIVVGMSQALVVIKAEVRSGSMASANWAAEMGRDVWCVPGSSGTDMLIDEGACEWKL